MEINKEYLVLQTQYHKMNNDKDNIFPKEWYNKKEYELKIKILKECINYNILIENSKLYNELKSILLNGDSYGRD